MEVFTYGNPEASAILIQMVGGHDLAVIGFENDYASRFPMQRPFSSTADMMYTIKSLIDASRQ